MLSTNHSIWKASDDPLHNYPPLLQTTETDILMIGGGISGIACAVLLARLKKNHRP